MEYIVRLVKDNLKVVYLNKIEKNNGEMYISFVRNEGYNKLI